MRLVSVVYFGGLNILFNVAYTCIAFAFGFIGGSEVMEYIYRRGYKVLQRPKFSPFSATLGMLAFGSKRKRS